ncbi:MAG: low molecular weight protein-tyrosine-phosphatase [Ilumatobacteraceae bacterium]
MRVCFVCLGNICRSPAAEAVFVRLATDAGLDVEVDSAGTSSYNTGRPPHPATLAEASRRGISIDHVARQFTPADFATHDLVVVMDAANRREVVRLAPDDAARAKIVTMRSFAPDLGDPDADIPDPYGLAADAYVQMFDLLDASCRGLVAHVADLVARPSR